MRAWYEFTLNSSLDCIRERILYVLPSRTKLKDWPDEIKTKTTKLKAKHCKNEKEMVVYK